MGHAAGVAADLPLIPPMLATLGEPPTGVGWAVEFKWDGSARVPDVSQVSLGEPGVLDAAVRRVRSGSSGACRGGVMAESRISARGMLMALFATSRTRRTGFSDML